MTQENIRVILDHTSHPGNIGATARAMKNMNMHSLALVKPKLFPDEAATVRASGADDILNNATIYQNINDAISECNVIFATSGRKRQYQTKIVTPREAAVKIQQLTSNNNKVGLLFGNEQHGLNNEDILKSDYQIIIPSNNKFCSLNLAAAVQIICYEIMQQYSSKDNIITKIDELATKKQIEDMLHHINDMLTKIDFIKNNSAHTLRKIRLIINNITFSKTQVQIVRGIITKINNKIQKGS